MPTEDTPGTGIPVGIGVGVAITVGVWIGVSVGVLVGVGDIVSVGMGVPLSTRAFFTTWGRKAGDVGEIGGEETDARVSRRRQPELGTSWARAASSIPSMLRRISPGTKADRCLKSIAHL